MAERLTTNQEVPGSTPGWIGFIISNCLASRSSVFIFSFYIFLLSDVLKAYLIFINHQYKVRWLNGRASDYESGGSRFDPWVDRFFLANIRCCFCSSVKADLVAHLEPTFYSQVYTHFRLTSSMRAITIR